MQNPSAQNPCWNKLFEHPTFEKITAYLFFKVNTYSISIIIILEFIPRWNENGIERTVATRGLHYRRDWLLWVTDGRAQTLMDQTDQVSRWLCVEGC